MPSPKVSYDDLEDEFLFVNAETRHYWLDKHTGGILSYGDEAARAVEEGDVDDLPDWMKPEVEAVTEVLRAFGELPGQDEQSVPSGPSSVDGYVREIDPRADEGDRDDAAADPNRYVSIEQIPSHEAFQYMADFVDELSQAAASDELGRALRGRRPFRRFKDVLLDFPEVREQWFEYEARRRREYIEEWARDKGIELDFGADTTKLHPGL
jgi:hypothetical protein